MLSRRFFIHGLIATAVGLQCALPKSMVGFFELPEVEVVWGSICGVGGAVNSISGHSFMLDADGMLLCINCGFYWNGRVEESAPDVVNIHANTFGKGCGLALGPHKTVDVTYNYFEGDTVTVDESLIVNSNETFYFSKAIKWTQNLHT